MTYRRSNSAQISSIAMTRGATLVCVTAGLLLTGLGSVQAGDCKSTGSNAYQCTGDFDEGFNIGSVVNPTSTQSITVEQLSGNIAPDSSSHNAQGNGVLWQSGTQPTTLVLKDASNSIIVDAATHSTLVDKYAVLVTSSGGGTRFGTGAKLTLDMPATSTNTGVATVAVVGTGSNGSRGMDECCETGKEGKPGGSVGAVEVTGSGAINGSGSKVIGVHIKSTGGNGGEGGKGEESPYLVPYNGGAGGHAGNVGAVSVNSGSDTSPWEITTKGSDAAGLAVSAIAGNGGTGGEGEAAGGDGRDGATGGQIAVGGSKANSAGNPAVFNISTAGTNAAAIQLNSIAGQGGSGAKGVAANGGNAANGGAGGLIAVDLQNSTLQTTGTQSAAIFAKSEGGAGGDGGSSEIAGKGKSGGVGRGGGNIDIGLSGSLDLTTTNTASTGIAAFSVGGRGGKSGTSGAIYIGPDGSGGVTGDSGDIKIDVKATDGTGITTQGYSAVGIFAQSIAGHGGSATNSVGVLGFGAAGGSAGAGGTVKVENAAVISTMGNVSNGISALAIGGGGGDGGSGFGAVFAKGGSGGEGGNGGIVSVTNSGQITTVGNGSQGIFAQSIGGTGGSGGSSGALLALGGVGGAASNGNTVTIVNTGDIATGTGTPNGNANPEDSCKQGCSQGIFAQSIGGGGGHGGSSGGWFSIGGAGKNGGNANTVKVTNNAASVSTTQVYSPAIVAQSLGGGGGFGGNAAAGGADLSAAVGGNGAAGGAGAEVDLMLFDGSEISTKAEFSHGILGQSIGGGGGAGGYAVDVTVGSEVPAVSIAIGGTGGKGGTAGVINFTTKDTNNPNAAGNTISTEGDHSGGLVLQSIGGGGGHGGTSVSVAGSNVSSLALGVGGSGGSGGNGAGVTAVSETGITTTGDHSDGLLVQSIGGGGGHGGTTADIALSTTGSLSIGLGGDGGSGGTGRDINVTSSGDEIKTGGDFSHGVLVQSIGGGGGKGGTAIAGSISAGGEDTAALAFGLGGKGKTGGNASETLVTVDNTVSTSGEHSGGIIVQSIGGGGGNGGTSIAATVQASGGNAVELAIGGNGGGAGNSGGVRVSGSGNVTTTGDHSAGIMSQSIGGGGGNGGLAISGSVTLSNSKSLSVAIGGSGGSGGSAQPASVGSTGSTPVPYKGSVNTSGVLADGMVAQSIGGGGGNGGTAISGNITTSESTAIGVSVGGDAKAGGKAFSANVVATGDVTASGDGARGIVAQSIAGGGGSGGMSITGNLSTDSSTKELGVSIGGGAGSGQTAAEAFVSHTGNVTTGTSNDSASQLGNAHAIVAQSIGGGGGTGGLAVNGETNRGNRSLTVSVGGSGGSGGTGSTTTVTQNAGQLTTHATSSHGILAQSIGGGGGDGGSTSTFELTNDDSKNISVDIGASGGTGAAANTVTVNNAAGITASGLDAKGIVAQSIGGGGGNGGSNAFTNQSGSNVSGQLTVGVGGSPGTGATGGTINVTNSGAITTGTGGDNGNDNAGNANATGHGIYAQSIGGGGGNGGVGIKGDVSNSGGDTNIAVGIGGLDNGSGGAAGMVTVQNNAGGDITTLADHSHGILVQSVAGGGGNGGIGIDGKVSNGGKNSLDVGVGGGGASGGKAGIVMVTNNASIGAAGDGSRGILAQSIGGGGGNGAMGINGDVQGSDDDNTNQIVVGVGGPGGASGSADAVTVHNTGTITTGTSANGADTLSTYMDGIFAQSIGGGGGNGATGINGNLSNSSQAKALDVGIGGAGGSAGKGGNVLVTNGAVVAVTGDQSRGIFAQSIGGGGGNGGAGISGSVSSSNDATSSTQLTVGIGLKAGNGASAGTVEVDNTASITTTALSGGSASNMHGIFAQSIGGGGGAGSTGVAGDVTNPTKSKSLQVGVGGGGGTGAIGNTVTVNNGAGVTVAGTNSRGIFAQSIGGGGGAGGIGVAGNVSNTQGGSGVTQLEVGVGASGGTGGTGGNITVNHTAGAINTTQAQSTDALMHGIFAQSVGGGGGDGGMGINGNVNGSEGSKALTVGVGGSGSSGGDGGGSTVKVSGGSISTLGDGSVGVFAQSIGGGGGNGAVGFNGTVSGAGPQDNSDAKKGKTLTVAVGAAGGAGGTGGNVMASNAGSITTGSQATSSNYAVSQAHGMFAQSIGGGGGNGVLTGSILYGGSSSGKGIAMTMGGASGGGNGGTAEADNTGSIITNNFASHGVFAQSIGGGGGTASDIGGQGAVDKWLVAISVGGSGGGAGDGNTTTIKNGTGGVGGNVSTSGDGAYALFAQSVGGGGGTAGNAAGLSNTGQSNASTNNADVALNLGGSNSTSGNGGTVNVTHSNGDLITRGVSAHGILAQSIGAGGGTAGTGAVALSGKVELGGTGSTKGDGGNVTVEAPAGSITTGASATAAGGTVSSFGILAQSVGGGGGIGGNTKIGDVSNFGSGLAMNSAGSDTTGDGGNVTVEFATDVTTSGDGSIGVFAQSVGGGGGIKGDVNQTTGDALIGAGSGVGAAGLVQVTQDTASTISTSGDNAYGIFAQQAAGNKDNANSLTVTVRGTITTSGANAHGVFASSSSLTNSNDTIVEVDGGSITVTGQGATGIYARTAGQTANSGKVVVDIQSGGMVRADNGVGVFSDAPDPASAPEFSIDSGGSLFSKNGTALSGAWSTAESDGSLSGNLSVTGLTQGFVNKGNFDSGSSLSLGAAIATDTTELSNSGTLSPGGSGTIATTNLVNPVPAAGDTNYTQTSDGNLAIDINAVQSGGSGGAVDSLKVAQGKADLSGTVTPTLNLGKDAAFGQHTTSAIVSAQGGVSAATKTNLTIKSSVVGQFGLTYPSGNDIALTYNVQFDSDDANSAVRDNRQGLISHLQSTVEGGGMSQEDFETFLNIESPEAYRDATDSLSPEIYADSQLVALRAAVRFADLLMSCDKRDGLLAQGECAWLRAEGGESEQDRNSQSLGFDEDSWDINGGVQKSLDNDWHLGGAISYRESDIEKKAALESEGDQLQIGIVLKKVYDNFLLAGTVSGGFGSYDIRRTDFFGDRAKGDQDLWSVSGQIRGEYLYTFSDSGWYLKPRVDLGLDYLDADGVNEKGGGNFALEVEGNSDLYVNVQPVVELGTEWQLENGLIVRPWVSAGVTGFLGDTDMEVKSGFRTSPDSASNFTSATQFDSTYYDFELGVDVLTKSSIVVQLNGFSSVSDNNESYGGAIKVAIPF